MFRLFDSTGFMPKAQCGTSWTATLVVLSQLSNLLVVIGYLSIAVQIYFNYLHKNKQLPRRIAFNMFASFPIVCALSRINNVLTFWWAPYRYYILIDFLCGVTLILLSFNFKYLISYLLNLEEFQRQVHLNETLNDQIRKQESSYNKVVTANRQLTVFIERLEHIIKSEMWIHDKRTTIEELETILKELSSRR